MKHFRFGSGPETPLSKPFDNTYEMRSSSSSRKRKNSKSDDGTFISVQSIQDIRKEHAESTTKAAEDHDDDDDNMDWEDEDESSSSCPPWMAHRKRTGYQNRNVFLRLHEEILDFMTFVSPTEAEKANREVLRADMEAIVTECWPNAKFEIFGSTSTEMYLPTSDVDMVVYECPDETPDSLHILAAALQDKKKVSYLEIVSSARIPLVKFEHIETGLQCDVVFNIEGGRQTAKLIRMYMSRYPAFRPLVLSLKYFLVQRKLNDTFQGGIGSFLLQMMVLSFLQHNAKENQRNFVNCRMYNLGHLFVGFFSLYGCKFNYESLAISVRRGGSYFYKEDRKWYDPNRHYLLSVENPNAPQLDVGKNAYDIRRIQRIFHYAHSVLQLEISLRGGESVSGVKVRKEDVRRREDSILGTVINVDSTLAARRGPKTVGYVKEIEHVQPTANDVDRIFSIGTFDSLEAQKEKDQKRRRKARRRRLKHLKAE